MGSACGPHGPYVPDVLFWCVILFFSTVIMSAFLKDFKFSNYFPTKVLLFIHCYYIITVHCDPCMRTKLLQQINVAWFMQHSAVVHSSGQILILQNISRDFWKIRSLVSRNSFVCNYIR